MRKVLRQQTQNFKYSSEIRNQLIPALTHIFFFNNLKAYQFPDS